MQTSVTPATTVMSTSCKAERRESAAQVVSSPSACLAAIGQQQEEVVLLLEEAQEQLRALAHRKQEEGGVSGGGSTAAPVEARETVCFLNLNGGGAGALIRTGPTQTQLLSPCRSHRDPGHPGQ